MYDSSSFANPTPLARAGTSRDVLPRGGTSQTVNVEAVRNILRNYSRAFGDRSRNFEPWSSDEDDTLDGTPLPTSTPHQREDV
ncbi:hypothetical protein TNCV_3475371 [Trichonephila clavipes]|nr:hypothetical protein TNCV_3475371 [Trichonephila clavipes]